MASRDAERGDPTPLTSRRRPRARRLLNRPATSQSDDVSYIRGPAGLLIGLAEELGANV
jgi:hypothetical protein